MVDKSLYVEDKKFEKTCSSYTIKHESDIVNVWEVAETKESTE